MTLPADRYVSDIPAARVGSLLFLSHNFISRYNQKSLSEDASRRNAVVGKDGNVRADQSD